MKDNVKRMTFAAMFLAIAYVLPFITGQIPEIGQALCPMHIPVLLCGFICGWQWGGVVGFVSPLLRSLTLGHPPVYPAAVGMAFELATYGFLAGLLFRALPKKLPYIYIELIAAMVSGRLVWGLAQLIMAGLDAGMTFTLQAFWAGAVLNAIPAIVYAISRAGLNLNGSIAAEKIPNNIQS